MKKEKYFDGVVRYRVTNIDGIIKEFTEDDEFLEYVQAVYHENEDGQPYPADYIWCPENIQQALEYIHEYCDNLTLVTL